MITGQHIQRTYRFFRKCAAWFLSHSYLETAAKMMELTSQIGYKYNFQYCDDVLEDLVVQLSTRLIPESVHFEPLPKKVVFFDSFAMDHRGLTMQYLRALKKLDYEILFVCTFRQIGEETLQEIESNPNATILHLNDASIRMNVTNGLGVISQFKPRCILQHFLPNDITGFCLCQPLTDAKRFLINITDHAFWLGKSCCDYLLEFRRYGAYVSHFLRHIPFERLLLAPYYPIEGAVPFQGFPTAVPTNKTLVFAGGTYYKMYGKNGLFLEIIRRVLEDNPDTVFLLAGNGNDKPIHTFIRQHHLEDRLFLLGNRRDISEVIRHIDLYVNTYPMIGGLMSQLAVLHHKPVIGYTDEDLFCYNDVEDLLQLPKTGNLVKTTLEAFHTTINRLINDKTAYLHQVELADHCLMSPEAFTEQLRQQLSAPQPIAKESVNDIHVPVDTIFDLYLDMDIHFSKEYPYLCFKKPVKIFIRSFLLKDLVRINKK